MSNDLTPEEIQNVRTFSSLESLEYYRTVDLLPVERAIIEKYLAAGATILDVGCGAGRTTIPLSEMGFSVIGIDISGDMIAEARKRAPQLDFRIGNVCHLEFQDRFADVVLFSWNGIDCIFPQEKRILALDEINRVLKPGGLFIFSTLNAWAGLRKREFLKELFMVVRTLVVQSPKYRRMSTHGGELITHQITPVAQQLQLRKSGFKLLALYAHGTLIKPSFNYNSKLKYFDAWPYYVAQKVKESAD